MIKRINRDNEDLLGVHYRTPGGVVLYKVFDVDPEEEGTVLVYNTLSGGTLRASANIVRQFAKVAA